MSRCRLMSNALAFSTSTSDNAFDRARLLEELARLRESYTTLMYGGQMQLRVRPRRRRPRPTPKAASVHRDMSTCAQSLILTDAGECVL